MNYVTYKGVKLPLFNTPLSNGEIISLKEKYDKFLIRDVRLNSVQYITNDVTTKRFRIDFGFKPAIYVTALVVGFYNYIQIKKKVKKKMKFNWGGNLDDFLKKEVKPNGAQPIEL